MQGVISSLFHHELILKFMDAALASHRLPCRQTTMLSKSLFRSVVSDFFQSLCRFSPSRTSLLPTRVQLGVNAPSLFRISHFPDFPELIHTIPPSM